MKEGEYFKVNSIEELEKAYHMFKGKWDTRYSLEEEIIDFNDGYIYVIFNYFGIYLGKHITSTHTEIQSPLRNINNLNKLI